MALDKNELWQSMVQQSFSPRQWFEDEPLQDTDSSPTFWEETIMWVYRRVGSSFVVGFYSPDREWIEDSTYDNKEKAAARVSYLNGGSQPSAV